MRNIRLTIAYDGTDFVGWQIQPNGPSVQAAVERAILQLTGTASSVLVAGRTDSGVHALAQVANFRSETRIPCEKLQTGLQTFLPDSIVIRNVDEVPDDFHATYSAKWKRYRYVILNSRVRVPFLSRYAYRVETPLDAAAMHHAAQSLVGRHDFRCFESQFPNKATSVRTVTGVTVGRYSGWPIWTQAGGLRGAVASDGDFICLEITADGFLYNVVRAIAGTLLQVGRARWAEAKVAEIIAAGDRSIAGETAPARGLYLVHVDYETPLPAPATVPYREFLPAEFVPPHSAKDML